MILIKNMVLYLNKITPLGLVALALVVALIAVIKI
jgi:hypothetical protein